MFVLRSTTMIHYSFFKQKTPPGLDPRSAGRRFETLNQSVIFVVVDQAAIGQNLALGIGQGTKLYGELLHTAIGLNSHGGHGIGSFQQSLAHAGQVDAVAQFKHAGSSTRKGNMPQLMQLER